MATNGLAPATPPGPSRSPSVNSAAEQVSDRDVAMDDDDSVGDSDSEGDRDDPTASSISLSITLPALATPKASSSSHPWPFTSVNQLSPTLSQHAPSMHEPPPAVPASSLPHEILLHILRLLPAESQAPALRVCKAWCQCGVELLWHKPSFSSMARLWKMIRVINSPDQTFPYRRFIRRLNFSSMHEHMTDDFILQLGQCERLERLTLAGCKLVGSEALVTLLSKTKRLIALDLSDMPGASDDVARTIAQSCPRLQGLNLSGCKGLTDRGLEAVARSCFELRRVSSLVFWAQSSGLTSVICCSDQITQYREFVGYARHFALAELPTFARSRPRVLLSHHFTIASPAFPHFSQLARAVAAGLRRDQRFRVSLTRNGHESRTERFTRRRSERRATGALRPIGSYGRKPGAAAESLILCAAYENDGPLTIPRPDQSEQSD